MYTDEQVPKPFSDLLERIRWDIQTSPIEGKLRGVQPAIWQILPDFQQLQVARELNRIFITFDELKGQEGAQFAYELERNGGKVIQILGGPEQNIHRSLGKIWFHFPSWFPFLQQNDGIAVLSDLKSNPPLWTPKEYSQRLSTDARPYFAEYKKHWQERELPKPFHSSLTPEQKLLQSSFLSED